MITCKLCNTEFKAKKINQKFCSLECQRLNNQRNWHSKNKNHVKRYREATKEQRNAARRKKYHGDKAYRKKLIANSKKYREKNPATRKEHELKTKYGISIKILNGMLSDQNNSCAICGFKDDGNKAFFPFVDHCHTTNTVRGLLCTKCNFGIGQFNDNIKLLKKAMEYLLEFNHA